MIRLEKIIGYLPKNHGEHGVDTMLHRIISKQDKLHEVFSNPPGGSWTQFDIIKPKSNLIFRWDHIPRAPADAKRPDLVIQFNEDNNIDFLSIESKKSKSEVYPDMPRLLNQFFTGSKEYIGLKDRPPWHYKRIEEEDWKVVKPTTEKKVRYWFKFYNNKLIKFWNGFIFALKPEYYANSQDINEEKLINDMTILLGDNKLDAILGVAWVEAVHRPVLFKVLSQDFHSSKFGKEFNKILRNWESPI